MLRQRNERTAATASVRRDDRSRAESVSAPPWRTAAMGLCATAVLLAGCNMSAPHVPVRENAQGGRDFYVSPQGDDSDDGRNPQTAWRTLGRADALRFKPGDRLRLQGGARFHGTLSIGQGDAGNPRKPVVIESYGKGRAVILASGTRGIEVHNTSGMTIRDLVVIGDSAAYRSREGIAFVSDLPGNRKLPYVRISRVEVTGFSNGIRLHGGGEASGFRDVLISDCTLHANKDAGLMTDGPAFSVDAPAYAHEKVTVSRVAAYKNVGDPQAPDRNTGSGIVLGSVRRGLVDRSVAHDNGGSSSPDANEGPEGIWTYDSTRITFQRNVSYGNHTGSQVDGGGFGLDNNVSHSVMQYNLAYGNDGAGFLAYSAVANAAHTDNTLRYNISHNDSRKLQEYGGIVALGARVTNLAIYHNTVLITASGPVRAPALRLQPSLGSVTVRNNVFVTDGSPVVASQSAFARSAVLLQGNDYHSGRSWSLQWGDSWYSDMAAWRRETGQETLGPRATGTDQDPCLARVPLPAAGPNLRGTGPTQGALAVQCARVLTGAAVDLRTLGVAPGPVDYFGAPLRGSPGVGAVQFGPTA
ncbi:right-handed parallel beta-helix repeat-containing protein [Streptomyces europaeiscabiei]|uniref:right-handed parallel beta-helix repeat-containing protein n=1 Tax=Streptomyces europaeiscabiei TaxID=146819 RepID=UPI0029BDEFB1|nr:right-handed parallel beta-helix repeat-containing protein [Streptomyces europaeiscabiei]MDX3695386.1 right-handed parallel beta-helix repeat-containing protein [Streptomyces europaeiscabiei]